MKKKTFTVTILFFCLSLVNIGLVQAVDDKSLEIDRPEIYQIPLRLVAEGTYFELNNSEYLNITAVSSKPVKIMLGSVLERITIHIEPVYDDASTQMTLGGFVPETTYHMHEDDYHNITTFTTDTKGTYTYVQELSKPHFVFIRPVFIPKDIPPGTTVRVINDNETGGDCTCIGNWDPDTKTCTLTTDLTDTIQIDSDNITLDGDGHVLSGNGMGYGVVGYGEKNGLTIRNLEIKNFSSGIYFGDFVGSGGIRNSTITHNTIINSAIYFYMYNNNNTISYNIFNKGGIHFRERNNYNTISHNILNGGSIYLSYFSNNNTISLNNISNNTGDDIGIWDYSSNNTIINNNINKPLINYGKGIVFWYRGNYNLVSGNNISNASIHQDMSSSCNTIINNTISGGSISCIMSGCSKIINNKIMNSPYSGIDCMLSYHNTIINNTISNSKNGISFGQETGNITVINNNISNTEYGIYLSWRDGTNHKIINNNIANNDYGIYIQNAFDNLIYHNNLYNNSIYNAYENLDTGSNQWDIGTIGNHWSDFDETCENCTDANGDGICDSYYYIPVSSGVDRYPLVCWGPPVPTVSFEVPITNLSLYSQKTINLTLDSAPNGLSGYNLTVSLSNSSVAEIISVEFPEWAAINQNSSLPGDSVWLTAADLNSQIENDAVDVPLAALTVRGDQTGNSNVLVTVTSMDDDKGNMINPNTATCLLEVNGVIPFPGMDMPPTDPDGDGLYEDINGNGRKDFNDVVLFFNNIEWVSDNEPTGCFDFNGNDRIDFDDIIKLFEEL